MLSRQINPETEMIDKRLENTGQHTVDLKNNTFKQKSIMDI